MLPAAQPVEQGRGVGEHAERASESRHTHTYLFGQDATEDHGANNLCRHAFKNVCSQSKVWVSEGLAKRKAAAA